MLVTQIKTGLEVLSAGNNAAIIENNHPYFIGAQVSDPTNDFTGVVKFVNDKTIVIDTGKIDVIMPVVYANRYLMVITG